MIHTRREQTAKVAQWRPVLNGEEASIARNQATHVLNLYRDREKVLVEFDKFRTSTVTEIRNWPPVNLSIGDTAVALALGHMSRVEPDNKWDEVAHGYLKNAVSKVNIANPSLFQGLSGLAFVLRYLSQGEQRYAQAREKVDELLYESLATVELLSPNKHRIKEEEYDLVSGAAGIALHLLYENNEILENRLNYILEGMIERCLEPSKGFRVFLEDASIEAKNQKGVDLKKGYINSGLAHGLPGPINILAVARLRGHNSPLLLQALEKSSKWLASQGRSDAWGTGWPYFIFDQSEKRRNYRTAWCYGSPGIAWALYMAGKSLQDESLIEFACNIFISVRSKPISARMLDMPTFCHGVAGLLQIALRIAHETGREDIREFSKELSIEIMSMFNHSEELGFWHREHTGDKVFSPGLMTGALGPALSLLAASTDIEPQWDCVFLPS